jgi:hypothetical protein
MFAAGRRLSLSEIKTRDRRSNQPISMIALDLADEAEAWAVAKNLAQNLGRTVTVRDAAGNICAIRSIKA